MLVALLAAGSWDPPAWLGLVAVVLTIAGTVGAASVVFINRAKDEIIDAQSKRITDLKEEGVEKASRCAEEIAELKGRLSVLESTVLHDIGGAIARAVVDQLGDRLPRRPVKRT